MNRSMLLVICDFLLLSLLALARFDAPITEETPEEEVGEAISPEAELVDILKMSLEAERQAQEDLEAQLESANKTIETKDNIVKKTETELELTQKRLNQETKEKTDLMDQREMLQQEKGDMAQNLIKLREQNILERERLRQAQLEIEKKQNELEQKQQTVAEMEEQNEKLEKEKQIVLTELKVAETKQVLITQQLENKKLEVEFERQQRKEAEKQTQSLTEGVKVLAGTSVEIKEEIKQLQPKTPNALYTEYKRNRIRIRFDTVFPGLFKDRNKTYEVDSILIRDTKNIYAILHTETTPFDLTEITPVYDSVNVTLQIKDAIYHPEKLAFMRIDPRIMLIPIEKEALEDLDVKVYDIVLEPFRFPNAVVIDCDNNYFGESSFKVHNQFSHALEMDKKIISKLFGEFSPSRGDLVLAQTGEFMGVMINNDYAGLVDHISTSDTIWLGDAFDSERTNTIITKLSNFVFRRRQ